MSWTPQSANVFANETGYVLELTPDGWVLYHEDFPEGILPLSDLAQNPIMPFVALDATGKIPPEFISSLLIANTVFADSEAEMLALTTMDVQKGDVCIRRDVPGGASFRLMGDDPHNITHWAELLARFVNWNDIRSKPTEYPPEDHEHDERYPRMNAGKILPQFLPVITLGSRFVANSETEMLNLPATKGDVCSRRDLSKTFLLAGLADHVSDWVEILTPDSGVASVNGQMGDVFLTPADIGASEEDHEHDLPDRIVDEDGNIFEFKTLDDILYFRVNDGDWKEILTPNSGVASVNGQVGDVVLTPTNIGAALVVHTHPLPDTILDVSNENLKFKVVGNLLYWSSDDGSNWFPFA